ncbi:hypothetical protein D9M71_694590 [compost metagenome]
MSRLALGQTMPLNSLPNSSLQPNRRRCRCRLSGAWWVKLTLKGCQCEPSRAEQRRNITPMANSLDWRQGIGDSVTTSSRMITILPASSMKIASESLSKCR